MLTSAVWLSLLAAAGMASTQDVADAMTAIGDGDLVLMRDPTAGRPVRTLLATRVGTSPEHLIKVIGDPASYGKAMPSFRKVDVTGSRKRGLRSDVHVAWELEVPLWNLKGKLWMVPRADGVDLHLVEGDFAPGVFHLSAGSTAGRADRALLTVEGFANLSGANVAIRKVVQRSPMAEPMMTVAAAYVLLKSLAALAETGAHRRPTAPMGAPTTLPAKRNDAFWARLPEPLIASRKVAATVRSRPDGRLLQVEAGLRLATASEDATGKSAHPGTFAALPGWKTIVPGVREPGECADRDAVCWHIRGNLPLFSLDGTWKIDPDPWRARAVAGDTRGAAMGLDFVPSGSSRSTMVLSQHPRLDKAGFVPRKLIAAEPFLEHGLALALTLIQAVSLAPPLEKP